PASETGAAVAGTLVGVGVVRVSVVIASLRVARGLGPDDVGKRPLGRVRGSPKGGPVSRRRVLPGIGTLPTRSVGCRGVNGPVPRPPLDKSCSVGPRCYGSVAGSVKAGHPSATHGESAAVTAALSRERGGWGSARRAVVPRIGGGRRVASRRVGRRHRAGT